MTTDHNEAMRLADHAMALSNEGPMIHAVSWTQINGTLELCANTIRQKSARIAELEARVHTCGPTCSKAGCINRRLTAERDTLRAELDTERMRLSACGVVAMANTAESAAKARDMHTDYLCASVRDVAAAVDREMALRAEVERLKPNAERYEWLRDNYESDWAICEWQDYPDGLGYYRDARLPSIVDTAIDTARKATQ